MNLRTRKPKIICEDSTLLTIKKTDTFIQQKKTKARILYSLNFKKSIDSFSIDIPLQLENADWLLALYSLVVQISPFPINEESIRFELSKVIEKKEKRYYLEDFKECW